MLFAALREQMFNVSARVVIIHKAEKQASKFLTLGCVYTSVVKDDQYNLICSRKNLRLNCFLSYSPSVCFQSIQGLSSLVTFRGKGSLSHFSSRASPNQPSSLLCPGCSSCLDFIHLNPGPLDSVASLGMILL